MAELDELDCSDLLYVRRKKGQLYGKCEDFVVVDGESLRVIPHARTNWRKESLEGAVCIGTLHQLSMKAHARSEAIYQLFHTDWKGYGVFILHSGKRVKVKVESLMNLYFLDQWCTRKHLSPAFRFELEEQIVPIWDYYARKMAFEFLCCLESTHP